MISFPGCKINIGLWVTSKRQDGFHNLETFFYPVELEDMLEIVEIAGNSCRLDISGVQISGTLDSNICIKAYLMMKRDFELPSFHIHLHKKIPVGAGLGGGSSNGAAMVKMIDEYCGLNLSDDRKYHYLRNLGSDCSFFLKNKPVLAFGKGDEFKDCDIDLSRYFLVIVKPEFSVSTAEAYRGIKPEKREESLEEIVKMPPARWRELLDNQFERQIFIDHPELKNIKEKIYSAGAVYASMSGSGSAVFGLYESEVDLEKDFPFCFYWGGFLR